MPRGNPKNLIQNSDTTPEQRKEIARKAGIASGEAKRARKTLREELLALLSDDDTQSRMSISIIQKAIDGDVRAFEVVRDTIGEKPVEKHIVADVDPSVIDEVERMVNGDTETMG